MYLELGVCPPCGTVVVEGIVVNIVDDEVGEYQKSPIVGSEGTKTVTVQADALIVKPFILDQVPLCISL